MWRRFFSDSKVYTATINLPKTKFPGRLKPKERLDVQKRVNQDVLSQVYSQQNDPNTPAKFILHDGPPYANGDLHMGHAVNKVNLFIPVSLLNLFTTPVPSRSSRTSP